MMTSKKTNHKVIELENVSRIQDKSTIGIQDINFSIKEGEVVALVGEPGSGIRTISQILSGYLSPTSGNIILNCKEYNELQPNQALQKGIVTASFRHSLCLNMNILENLLLIAYKKNSRFGFINYSGLREEALRFLNELDSDNFSLDVPLNELDLQDIPIIEIVKALLSKAKLYVFDEVTSQLKEKNFIQLVKIIQKIKAQNISFLYIPSTFGEVFEIADRVIVLRNGRITTKLTVEETNIDELPELVISSEKPLISSIKNRFTNLEISSGSMKDFINSSIAIFKKMISLDELAIIWNDNNLIKCEFSKVLEEQKDFVDIFNQVSEKVIKLLIEDDYQAIQKYLDEKISHIYKKYKLLPIAYEEDIIGVVFIFQNSLRSYYMHKRIFYNTFDFLTRSLQNYIIKEHQKREERELETAGQIQQNLTTPDFKSFKKLDVFGYSKAAKTVGGDYFDLFKIDGHKYAGIIVDVSGKGIPAALIMVMIRSIMKNAINTTVTASELMSILNKGLTGEIPEDRYATAFLFIIDTQKKTIDYCNGGHHSMLLIRKDDKGSHLFSLDSPGVPIGIIPDYEYTNKLSSIQNGDMFIIYTDGITEAMNKEREEFGKSRLIKIINRFSDLSCEELSRIINKAIVKFSEGKQHDDETLLLFKLK